jgi:hypothetical protein
MKIVIEVIGDQIRRIDTDTDSHKPPGVGHAGPAPMMPPPGPAPAAVLERARRLGAVSAGAARWGTGVALAATAEAGERLVLPGGPSQGHPKPKRRAQRKRR